MSVRNFFSKLFFYRQHPDAALRYLPIVDLLKENNWQNKKILEIGSGSYGIAPYLKKKITGVDLEFNEPKFNLLEQVKGSATNLPFKENEFDVVILSDVLEHISEIHRKKVLTEAVRVAKIALIISGPFGKKAGLQDAQLADYSLKKLGILHPYFEDHLRLGLPEIDQVMNYLDNDQVLEIKKVGHFLNLKVRFLLMKFFITKSKLIFYLYLKGLMFLVPLFKIMNWEPCYRTLLIASLKKKLTSK